LAGTIFVFYLLSQGKVYPKSVLSYGMTFSEPYAQFLGWTGRKFLPTHLMICKLKIPPTGLLG